MNWRIILCALFGVLASSGDESSIYRMCVRKCVYPDCEVAPPLSWILRLTLWDCPQNCMYECMHAITDDAVQTDSPVQQYHGKWPFYRLLGMQEPASVLFSIMNGLGHGLGLWKYKRRVGARFPYRTLFIVHGYVMLNAWVWSAVFHSRDFPFTERMDYFSAMAVILGGLIVCLHRVMHLELFRIRSIMVFATSFIFYCCHVIYLSFGRFDYKYNMIAGITVGMLQNIIWLGWSAANLISRPYAWRIGAVVLLMLTGTHNSFSHVV